MYLRLKGDSFTENIFKEVQAITNYAIVYFQQLEYDEEKRIVSVPIERYRIQPIKKVFWGIKAPYKYDKNFKIPSLIVIRNITDCRIEKNFDDPSISEISILFGLQVKDNEIYLCSVEESRGQTFYTLKLKVSELDIEIRDQNEAGQ